MALSASILRKIRHEVGKSEFTGIDDDDELEVIFNDADEGNSSVLVTAYIVWRHRLAELSTRAFDVATEGSLLSRNQRIRYMERRVAELAVVADGTLKAENMTVRSPSVVSGDSEASAEFS